MSKIIGVTGGIGSGKSSLINYIQSKGFPVYLADEAGKSVMEKPHIIAAISKIFNENVLLENGLLNRSKIAKIVFEDKNLLNKLNQIVHPAVAEDFKDFIKKNENQPLIFKEAAILFESGSYLNCDATILVTAPEDVRIERVILRDGVSRDEVLKRMSNQMSDSEKMNLATYVVENLDINKAKLEIDKIIDKIVKS